MNKIRVKFIFGDSNDLVVGLFLWMDIALKT